MPSLVVIDDDPAVLLVLRRAFQNSDVNVLTAECGAGGLEAIRRHRPDAALVDIRLPDMDGLGLFQKLRERDATLPVIFV
jgi:DNA-binding response OmpR family regulator